MDKNESTNEFGAWENSMPREIFWQLGTGIVQCSAAERQERNMAGLLDGRRHNTLVPGTGAGLAARADLAVFRYIFAKQVNLLIFNDQQLVCAKLTKLGLGEKPAVSAAALAAP